MKDEYIIINKTAIQQRIKELEILEKQESMSASLLVREEIETLQKVLSQSTPLIPVIDRAYDAGKLDKDLSLMFDNSKARYISNLKLEI